MKCLTFLPTSVAFSSASVVAERACVFTRAQCWLFAITPWLVESNLTMIFNVLVMFYGHFASGSGFIFRHIPLPACTVSSKLQRDTLIPHIMLILANTEELYTHVYRITFPRDLYWFPQAFLQRLNKNRGKSFFFTCCALRLLSSLFLGIRDPCYKVSEARASSNEGHNLLQWSHLSSQDALFSQGTSQTW